MAGKYQRHPLEERFIQDTQPSVPEAWRGNCPCGKWLVVPRSFTREKPFVCGGPCDMSAVNACGRRWFVEGNNAWFVGGPTPAPSPPAVPAALFAWSIEADGAWFRIRGYGLSVRNLRTYKPLFSERMRVDPMVDIGRWRFKLLRPVGRSS